MRYGTVILMMLLIWTITAWADMGFDDRYERDYNIFNPITRYQPDNPLNPANTYSPDNPFQSGALPRDGGMSEDRLERSR